MRIRRALFATFMAFVTCGCDVQPLGANRSGIPDLDMLSEEECGRGFLIVSSDYQSSNVSAIDRRGNVLSSALAGSSMATAGLVQAFSGDVVLPSERQRGNVAILVDRYPQSVLSYLDLRSAEIVGQTDVATGFAANPHDVLQLDDGRLVVTRFDSELDASVSDPSNGGDLLVLDPERHAIAERIDLRLVLPGVTGDLLPHPDRMRRVGTDIYLVVALYSPNYRETGASYVVKLDANSLDVQEVVELTDLVGCSGLSVSPDEREVAIVCSGAWGSAKDPFAARSGIVGLDITGPMQERWRLLATDLHPALPFGFSLDYADDGRILTVALGRFADASHSAERDRFVYYDVKTQKAEILYESEGVPFVLGDVRCLPRCGRCVLANATGRGRLMLFDVDATGIELVTEIASSPDLGLPPRWLGTF